MRKIPTLLKRDPDNMRLVLMEVNPGCEWVLAGEGVATRKYDGTCVKKDADGSWWARREVKPEKQQPDNYIAEETDPNTGKTVGWEPIEQSSFHKFFIEALGNALTECLAEGWEIEPGTYELCGPKINQNPEGYPGHYLVSHAEAEPIEIDGELTLGKIADVVQSLSKFGVEGIVWHHPDGRMVKIKAKDFGFKRTGLHDARERTAV